MSAQDDWTCGLLAQQSNRRGKAGAISRSGCWRRRPKGAPLAKGQVAAQNPRARGTERVGNRHEQSRCSIPAGPVSQYESTARRLFGFMQKSADMLVVYIDFYAGKHITILNDRL